MSAEQPAALEKAKSLHNFASHSGSPLKEFVLCLSQAEALELVEWYAMDYAGQSAQLTLTLRSRGARRTPGQSSRILRSWA